MSTTAGARLRTDVSAGIVPFIGVHDVLSATLAARHFPALFVSGFGVAASQYGLPDVGFLAWTDVLSFVERTRAVVPHHHLLVDIDDGYSDVDVACHAVRRLEALGASGVVLEDQRRPRRCGHLGGKQILELDEYLVKLRRVLDARTDLVVIARTDASEPEDVVRRVRAYAAAGADVVLADGLGDLDLLRRIRAAVSCPVAFNQISGGRAQICSLDEMAALGVSVAIYSTPCLFAAQAAIDDALVALRRSGGRLPQSPAVDLARCNSVLQANLAGEVALPAALARGSGA